MEEVKKYGSVSVIIDDSLVDVNNFKFHLEQMAAIRQRSIANEQQRKNAENSTTCK